MRQTLIDKFNICAGVRLSEAVKINDALLALPEGIFSEDFDDRLRPQVSRHGEVIQIYSFESSNRKLFNKGPFFLAAPKDATTLQRSCPYTREEEEISFRYKGVAYNITLKL